MCWNIWLMYDMYVMIMIRWDMICIYIIYIYIYDMSPFSWCALDTLDGNMCGESVGLCDEISNILAY